MLRMPLTAICFLARIVKRFKVIVSSIKKHHKTKINSLKRIIIPITNAFKRKFIRGRES